MKKTFIERLIETQERKDIGYWRIESDFNRPHILMVIGKGYGEKRREIREKVTYDLIRNAFYQEEAMKHIIDSLIEDFVYGEASDETTQG